MAAFPSKMIAVISSASTVNYSASLCVLASMCMDVSLRIERKHEVGLRVYTKTGDVARGS